MILKRITHYIFGLLGFKVSRLRKKDISPVIVEAQQFLWLKEFDLKKIIDIGSNEGQFAEKILTIVPNASIHCFEPIPSVFASLKNRFVNNPFFHFYNFALGSEEGTGIINLNEYSPSSSILEMEKLHKDSFEFTKSSTKQQIAIKRLDDFIEAIKPTQHTMVKIDVQGYEMQVLLGGSSFIKLSKIVIVEMSFEKLYEDQPLFHEVYTELYRLGFSYHGNLEQLISPTTSEILQADCIFINRNL